MSVWVWVCGVSYTALSIECVYCVPPLRARSTAAPLSHSLCSQDSQSRGHMSQARSRDEAVRALTSVRCALYVCVWCVRGPCTAILYRYGFIYRIYRTYVPLPFPLVTWSRLSAPPRPPTRLAAFTLFIVNTARVGAQTYHNKKPTPVCIGSRALIASSAVALIGNRPPRPPLRMPMRRL